MTIEALGMFLDGTKTQYLRTMVRGELLRQFEIFSAELVSATP